MKTIVTRFKNVLYSLSMLLAFAVCVIPARCQTFPPSGEDWHPKPTPKPTPDPTPVGLITAPGGKNGVNRRVEITGSGAVQGWFSEPTFNVNTNTMGLFGFFNGRRINEPSFYLGISNDPIASLEGGLQWAPQDTRNPAIKEGWTVFYNGTVSAVDTAGKAQTYNHWKQTLSKYRRAKGTLGSTFLSLEPNSSGKMALTVKSSQWGNQSPDPITGIWTLQGGVNKGNIKVRRVMALTQTQAQGSRIAGSANHQTLLKIDGSYVENLNFYDGKVAAVNGASKYALTVGSFFYWGGEKDGTAHKAASDHNLYPDQHIQLDGHDGYDQQHFNTSHLYPDTRVNPNSPWIIDFQGSQKRPDDPSGKYAARYPDEKVVIDLRVGKAVNGKQSIGSTLLYPLQQIFQYFGRGN